MATRVYKFGVHYKWTRNIPESVIAQLRLAHDLRESLVDIYSRYEEGKRKIWEDYPVIRDLEAEIADLIEERKANNEAQKMLRIIQQTKKISGPDADRLKAEHKAITTRLTEAKTRLKREKNDALALEQMAEAFKLNKQERYDAEKATYAEFCQGRGLYHGTHYDVLENHKVACALMEKKRQQGNSASMRHHRFDGTGTLTVFLKKGRDNTRRQGEVANLKGPHRNTFCVTLPDEDGYDSLTWAQRRHAGYAIARFRIAPGKDEGAVIEIPVFAHRPLPKDAIIKSASLVIKRIGTRKVATVNIRADVPDPVPVDEDTTCAIHFGWRKEDTDEKTIRVATFRADTPITQEGLDKLRTDPRYADLKRCINLISPMHGQIHLPTAWLTGFTIAEQLHSQRDQNINRIKEILVDWLGDIGPVQHPFYVDRETGAPEMVTAARVTAWKNPIRLVHLATGWRDNPPNKPDADRIVAELEQWRKLDKTLHNSAAGVTARTIGRREDIYSQIANFFAQEYGHLVMDDVDFAEVTATSAKDERVHNDLLHTWQRQRAIAATGSLREKMVATAHREGLSIENVKTAFITAEHYECGALNARLPGQMKITCQQCGQVYDVDANAMNHITQRTV